MTTATAPQPTAISQAARAWAVGFGGGRPVIMRSEDSGATWSVIHTSNADSGMHFSSVHFVNRNVGWVVGTNEILHTENGGDSWVSQVGNISGVSGPLLEKVRFSTDQRGLAVGTRLVSDPFSGPPVILFTMDGGEHWDSAQIAPGQNPALKKASLTSACVTSSGIGLAVGGGVSGSLALLSTDDGMTWSDITQKLGTILPIQPRDVACSGPSEMWIVGGGPARIAHSADGGTTWTDQTSSLPVDAVGEQLGVVFVDQNTGWLTGGGVPVLRTVDRGATWVQQALPGGTDEGGSLLAISFATPMFGATVGMDETDITARKPAAFATHDGGLTWVRAFVPFALGGLFDVSVVQ